LDHEASRAVLIGVSDYDHAEFTPILAARNSVAAMQALLSDPELCGWPRDRITVISDPRSVTDLGMELTELARKTTGVFLLYYVGHGKVTERGELCLTVSSTNPEHLNITGLRWETVRQAFLGSAARVRIAVLDCCFAGRAIEALSGTGDQALADLADIRGSYVLTAASSNNAAHVPPPDEQQNACTSFTAELRDLVRAGIPGKPDWLSFSDIYPELRRRLRAKGLPTPERRGTNTADLFGFTMNAATRRVSDATASPDASSQPHRVALDADGIRHSREMARAAELIVTLQGAVDRVQADLEEARGLGDASRVAALQQELAGRRALLDQAQKGLQALDG